MYNAFVPNPLPSEPIRHRRRRPSQVESRNEASIAISALFSGFFCSLAAGWHALWVWVWFMCMSAGYWAEVEKQKIDGSGNALVFIVFGFLMLISFSIPFMGAFVSFSKHRSMISGYCLASFFSIIGVFIEISLPNGNKN